MKKQLRRKIEETCSKYIFEQNDQQRRHQLIKEVEETTGFKFIDSTTPDLVDDNFVVIDGYDEKTKKILRITICPAKTKFEKYEKSVLRWNL